MNVHSYIKKIKSFLVKLQNLSDNKKKTILWTIVVIAAAIMLIFWFIDAKKRLSGAQTELSKIEIPKIETPIADSLKGITTPGGISDDIILGLDTYKNEDYGFEFQYPQEDISSGQSMNDLVDLTLSSGVINVFLNNGTIENGTLVNDTFGTMNNPKEITVGGKKAYQYKITKNCGGYLTAIPLKSNKILEICLNDCYVGGSGDPAFPDSQLDYLNQLFATFKFTPVK